MQKVQLKIKNKSNQYSTYEVYYGIILFVYTLSS